jgi:predicted transcriptional regulator
MIKSYQSIRQSQIKPSTGAIVRQSVKIDKFSDVKLSFVRLDEYKNSLTPSFKRILSFVFSLRAIKDLYLLNETVRKKAGCSTRTVQRGFKKLIADGLLSRTQEHGRSVFLYKLNPILLKGKQSYEMWCKESPQEYSDIVMKHGMIPPGKKRIIIKSKRTSPSEYVTLNIIGSLLKFKLIGQKRRKIRMNFLKKEEISIANFNEIVFSKIRKKIGSGFRLNRTENLKLFAFPESVLELAFKHFSWERGKGRKIGYGWFLSICIESCKKIGIKPDWSNFYRLCEEYGVDPKTRTNKTIPAKVEYKSASPAPKSVPDPVLIEIQEIIPPRTITEWRAERAALQKRLATYQKQKNPYKKFAIKIMVDEIANAEIEIAKCLDTGIMAQEIQ